MATNTRASELAPPLTSRAAIVAACTESLSDLTLRLPAVRFCCLSTVDGHLISKAGMQDEHACQRTAAIASSFLALSETFAKEGAVGRCTHTTISAEHGTIVAVRVPSRTRSYVLSVGADLSDNLASVLRLTLDAAEKVAKYTG